VPLRLLLDEHISPTIAYRLAELGNDVTCTRQYIESGPPEHLVNQLVTVPPATEEFIARHPAPQE
jgi:hypothetical protein